MLRRKRSAFNEIARDLVIQHGTCSNIIEHAWHLSDALRTFVYTNCNAIPLRYTFQCKHFIIYIGGGDGGIGYDKMSIGHPIHFFSYVFTIVDQQNVEELEAKYLIIYSSCVCFFLISYSPYLV